MAVAHRTRPQWGVQFHPESIATAHGRRLLANFRDLTASHTSQRVESLSDGERNSTPSTAPAPQGVGAPGLGLALRRIDWVADPERVFVDLYAESPSAFWLDSSRPGDDARFSCMGDASGASRCSGSGAYSCQM